MSRSKVTGPTPTGLPLAGHRSIGSSSPAGSFEVEGTTVALPDYWLDRLEVTNRQFKAFVDAGGYQNERFWTEPFVDEHGRRMSWAQAVDVFRDATGRPGPSTWELGTYLEGQADFPVAGVSWYEAVA